MKQLIKKITLTSCAAMLIAGGGVFTSKSANADSCWWHNGTLMRLQAQGNQRWFLYEEPRKSWMHAAGIRRGTLLFQGYKQGDHYSGTARRFSKFCPGEPLEYQVSGPVAPNQRRVTVFGDYEVHNRCQPTGRYKQDRLVFTYSHQC